MIAPKCFLSGRRLLLHLNTVPISALNLCWAVGERMGREDEVPMETMPPPPRPADALQPGRSSLAAALCFAGMLSPGGVLGWKCHS